MSIVKGLVALAVIGGGFYGYKHFAKSGLSAEEVAAQANRQLKLPVKIDDDVVLKSVTGKGDEVFFRYALIHYNRAELEPELEAALRPADQADLCHWVSVIRSQQVKMADGLRFTRELENSYGSKIYSVQVEVSSCA